MQSMSALAGAGRAVKGELTISRHVRLTGSTRSELIGQLFNASRNDRGQTGGSDRHAQACWKILSIIGLRGNCVI
jgi:hypothetical protein